MSLGLVPVVASFKQGAHLLCWLAISWCLAVCMCACLTFSRCMLEYDMIMADRSGSVCWYVGGQLTPIHRLLLIFLDMNIGYF